MKIKPTNNNPIGIVDSGFGGLAILSAINKILPYENIIYFGDTVHIPYGSKSKKTIIKYIEPIITFLMTYNIKLLVIACNTVSALALPTIQQYITIPIIGVIQPGVQLALSKSKNNVIGVICTETTLISQAYPNEIKLINNNTKVYQQSCPLLVPLIEEGWSNNKIIMNIVLKSYLKQLLLHNIDTLILGCTHYLLIKNILEIHVKKKIVIIDSAQATAKATFMMLKKMQLMTTHTSTKGYTHFFVSDNPNKFKKLGKKLFAKKIKYIKKIVL
ncbi:MAG: glutamate racemase [Endomicrobium sp.]|jgi:glutamate racemase|nr:glutamate racemase [Endomicrobium sp.]